MLRRLGLVFLLTLAGVSALWTGPRQDALHALAAPQPAPTHPSASCPQPDRHHDIRTLTLQQRIDQGYPIPIHGKTDPGLDQIIHDRGVHFCHDTDVPRTFNSAPTAPARNAAPSHANAESNNPIWSGNYADGGNNYTFVTAYWTESCIAWGTNDAYSTWVGIGGIGNNNLVQTGVDGVNANAFSHYYEAWVQNTGTNYDVNVFGVNCGDQIRTEVGTGDCMYVADATTGSTSGWRCQAPNANSSTAECIIERLSLSGSGLSPLSNFGNQTFHGCDVEINAGSNLGIGTVAHDYFNLYNGGTPLAVTGQISGGDTYTMTWQHYQ